MKSIDELNKHYADSFSKLGIKIPEILFPVEKIKLEDWAVVACDQYTSDHQYWNDVENRTKGKPSSFHITLPEIYLEAPDVNTRIDKILSNMKEYLASDTLRKLDSGIIYLERTTEASGLRQGLVFAMDLEKYDYSPTSKSLIRATEGTIVERIPPRLKVRSRADLELPHIMILIDDAGQTLIESLSSKKDQLESLYSVNLMKHGGTLSAWLIKDELVLDTLVKELERLYESAKEKQHTQAPLFFAMGDGNHSLATAKAHWEHVKEKLRAEGLDTTEIMAHPARYALAEIVNIHSPGLRFEPIHRAVFAPDPQDFVNFIKQHQSVDSCCIVKEADLQHHLHEKTGQMSAGLWDGKQFYKIAFTQATTTLPPASVDRIFNDYRMTVQAARIDFIHGWEDTKKLSITGAIGLLVPVISRDNLFSQVQEHGPLPRKAFSMGDAEEKKYYMECRRITK